MSRRRIVLGNVGRVVEEAVGTLVGATIGSTVVGAAVSATIGTTVVHARRALGTTVSGPFGAAVSATIGTTVMYARRAFCTAVSRSFGCGLGHEVSSVSGHDTGECRSQRIASSGRAATQPPSLRSSSRSA